MIPELDRLGNETTCPIAVVVKNGHLAMGFRHYTPDKWKTISVWTIPGGRCDNGETLEQTLRRETKEETGITDLKILKFIGEVPGAKEGDVVPIFACESDQDPQLMEPEKFSDWKWVNFADYINKNEVYGGFNVPARKLISEYLSKIKS
ncbi:MAG: NUDIX domain-containing protein [Candidatus Vogelbacteria bacterium]|nr:NUDIX domain-containing protein [Candidatus Vogelbacteria bacterium]